MKKCGSDKVKKFVIISSCILLCLKDACKTTYYVDPFEILWNDLKKLRYETWFEIDKRSQNTL